MKKTPEEKKAEKAKKGRIYRSKPEVKEQTRRNRARYFKDPEARRLKRLRNKRYRDKVKDTPEFKAKNAEYSKRPEVVLVSSARMQDKKRKLDLLKMGRPCYDCGGEFPLECMDWDHLPGVEKCFTIANYTQRTLESLLNEITKCQLVCSNCHRIRTKARRPEKAPPEHIIAIRKGREAKAKRRAEGAKVACAIKPS